jgi:hypothetical protein
MLLPKKRQDAWIKRCACVGFQNKLAAMHGKQV